MTDLAAFAQKDDLRSNHIMIITYKNVIYTSPFIYIY